MQQISISEVEHVAFALARQYYTFNEPIPDFTTRFPNILESCLLSPFQTYGKKDLYLGLIKKASILFYLMIKNHPFQNGNKRIAMTTLLYFLYNHDKWIRVDDELFYRFALWVTESPSDAKEQVIKYIEKFMNRYITPL